MFNLQNIFIMKKLLQFFSIGLLSSIVYAQGDDVTTATEIEGTALDLNILSYSNYSNSDLSSQDPSLSGMECRDTRDFFFKNTVGSGDDNVFIALSTTGTGVLTTMYYQVLKAPSGDLLQLEEVDCDNYTVLVAGGNFELIIDSNINPGDVFYVRVFEPSGVLPDLLAILDASTITMQSSASATLSTPEVESEKLTIINSNNQLRLVNNNTFNDYEIIDISGNALLSNKSSNYVDIVDVSNLAGGMYVLRLKNNTTEKLHKFIK